MNTFDIHMNALDKTQQKHVRKAYQAGANTVGAMRKFLVIGKVGGVVMTALTVLFLIGLGVLFFPLLFVAPVALVVVPLMIVADNQKWRAMLPAENDEQPVRLV